MSSTGAFPLDAFPVDAFPLGAFTWGSLVGLADDLPAAIVAWLRNHPSVVAAFNDGGSISSKFWADGADPVELPYLVYEEPSEILSAQSADAEGIVWYFGPGRIVMTVVAETKKQTRDLTKLLISTLDDAPIRFADGFLLEIRAEVSAIHYVPIPTPAPNSLTQYQRVIPFTYFVQRQF